MDKKIGLFWKSLFKPKVKSKPVASNNAIAVNYLKSGSNKYLILKDYPGAIDDFTGAIKNDPQCDGAYFLRGSAKLAINDYSGALEDLNKATEINPSLEEAHKVKEVIAAIIAENYLENH